MQGYMYARQLKDLRRIAAAAGAVTWVEVGVWRGLSAMEVYRGLKPGSSLHLVDPWNPEFWPDTLKEEATKGPPFLTLSAGVQTEWVPEKPIHIHRCTSVEASKVISSPEIVFIDGSHEYDDALMDLEAWGGTTTRTVFGHDWSIEGVRNAVLDYCAKPGCRWKMESQRHDIWFLCQKT